MLQVKIPVQHQEFVTGIDYMEITPTEDTDASGVYILDVERMFDSIEPELYRIAESGAPVILYAGTEAVNWHRWQYHQPNLHDFVQGIRGEVFFAVVSPAQGRLAVNTFGGAYWIHNHWERETWRMCRHWRRHPTPTEFKWEYLYMSRRTTHDRMWLYYTICNRGLDALCSVGWRNYWGDNNDGPDYERFVDQRLSWYPEPESALQWFRDRAGMNSLDCFEKLPDKYEKQYCATDDGDIYGGTPGLFQAHRACRVNIVADSAALKPHGHTIHTEKLWRSICAGQHTLVFGNVGYYHQLAELGYPVNPPHWDLEDEIPQRLNRFIDSVQRQDVFINIPGSRRHLKQRAMSNPLPKELG